MSGIKSAYGYPERAIHPERKKKEKEKNEGKMEEKKGGREKTKQNMVLHGTYMHGAKLQADGIKREIGRKGEFDTR